MPKCAGLQVCRRIFYPDCNTSKVQKVNEEPPFKRWLDEPIFTAAYAENRLALSAALLPTHSHSSVDYVLLCYRSAKRFRSTGL